MRSVLLSFFGLVLVSDLGSRLETGLVFDFVSALAFLFGRSSDAALGVRLALGFESALLSCLH